VVHAASGLEKATWTDADFEVMGWHDCRIHALSIGEHDDDVFPPARVMLDLDYIVRWVEPAPLWHVEGHNFELRLRAAAYTQYLRMPPQHVHRQVLTVAERGGLSFVERSFA
jgi:hypothetical protein